MASISLAAAFWLGLHLIVAGPLRVRLVGMLGEGPFRGIFSLLTIVGLVWFVFAYRAAPWTPLWPTIPALGYLAVVLVFLGFVLTVVGSGPMNPTATKPVGMIDNKLHLWHHAGHASPAPLRRIPLGHRALARKRQPRRIDHVRGGAHHGRERHGVNRSQTAPRARPALGRVRGTDLAPAIRRHPRWPHTLRNFGVPRLANRAGRRAFRRRVLVAWHRWAIAALGAVR